MPGVVTADLGELAVRVAEAVAPQPWFVLIVESPPEEVASELQVEISALAAPTGLPVRCVTIASSRELARVVHDQALGVLIVAISQAFASTEWASIDVNRSRFQRDGATVLVLEQDAAEQLENTAPNLASWIGGSI